MYDELVKMLRVCGDSNNSCGNCTIRENDGSCPHGEWEFAAEKYMLQAADAIEELICEVADEHNARLDAEERQRWIPVTERLPENDVHVLLSCNCGAGAYVCDGFRTEKYSTPTQFYEDIDADYDEETDEYYFPEGWWEVIKNWDDYSCVAIDDKVTHWMPLPQPPKEERA